MSLHGGTRRSRPAPRGRSRSAADSRAATAANASRSHDSGARLTSVRKPSESVTSRLSRRSASAGVDGSPVTSMKPPSGAASTNSSLSCPPSCVTRCSGMASSSSFASTTPLPPSAGTPPERIQRDGKSGGGSRRSTAVYASASGKPLSSAAACAVASSASVPSPAPASMTLKGAGLPSARHIVSSCRAASAPKAGCASGAV